MRKRHKRKVAWFPVNPTTFGEETKGVSFYENSLTFPNNVVTGDTSIAAIPLTIDYTQEPESDLSSLRDVVEGQEYICDRVVGNIWFDTPLTNQRLNRFLVCFAIAVLPVEDDNQSAPALPAEDYNPFFADNSQAPWYFRRVWKLYDTTQVLSNPGGRPTDISAYGGNTTFLDTMGVRRRIRKEQRLFAVTAAAVLDHTTIATSDIVRYGFDLRILGHMVKAQNKSTFK